MDLRNLSDADFASLTRHNAHIGNLMGAVAEVSWAIMDRAEESIWISFNGWSAEEKAADWMSSHNSAANDALGLHAVKLENWPDYLGLHGHSVGACSFMVWAFSQPRMHLPENLQILSTLSGRGVPAPFALAFIFLSGLHTDIDGLPGEIRTLFSDVVAAPTEPASKGSPHCDWVLEALELARAFVDAGVGVAVSETFCDPALLENGTVSESEYAESVHTLTHARERLTKAELELCTKFSTDSGDPYTSKELAFFMSSSSLPQVAGRCWECTAISVPGREIAQYCGECVASLLLNTQPPDHVRTSKDYAIEHGNLVAQSAENLLRLLNSHVMSFAGQVEVVGFENVQVPSLENSALTKLNDATVDLREAITAFRKRCERLCETTAVIAEKRSLGLHRASAVNDLPPRPEPGQR